MIQAAKKVSIDDLAIISLEVSQTELIAKINDGRAVSIPTAWFNRLAHAPSNKLKNFVISPSGHGIHWPDLDEDISIKAFINP